MDTTWTIILIVGLLLLIITVLTPRIIQRVRRKDLPTLKAGETTVQSPSSSASVRVTDIAKQFGLEAWQVNHALEELGWITADQNNGGWITTQQGKELGGEQLTFQGTGKSFVKWPETIVQNESLVRQLASINTSQMPHTNTTEYQQPSVERAVGTSTVNVYEAKVQQETVHRSVPPVASHQSKDVDVSTNKYTNIPTDEEDYRLQHPREFHCTDGHSVRSRGELLIDEWLFRSHICHGYEVLLHIPELIIPDFTIYTLDGKPVYIEYWGLMSDSKYVARREKKTRIYNRYNLTRIDIEDDDLKNLDYVLLRKLREKKVIV